MKRARNGGHLDFIRQLECLVCANDTQTEAAHVRMPDLRAGKRQTGMGEKPDDIWAVPLCSVCHRKQHRINEGVFWRDRHIDPIFVALALWAASGNAERARTIILHNRRLPGRWLSEL